MPVLWALFFPTLQGRPRISDSEGSPGAGSTGEICFFTTPPLIRISGLPRLDTNRQVGVNYHPEKAVNPKAILMTAIGPNATPEDKKTFPGRFQNMVKQLFDQSDRMIEVIEFSALSQKGQDSHE